MRAIAAAVIGMLVLGSAAFAQEQPAKVDPLKPFLAEDAPVLVLNNVRLIDGTGAAARENVRIDIDHGKIVNVQSALLRNAFPEGAKVIDMAGKTVFPGLVGMHEHLFYPLPEGGHGLLPLYGEMADSAPRLYLAGGVTSARTAGSLEPYTDISVKDAIDAGKIPGPNLFLTGPYLEGSPAIGPQLHALKDADDAARLVDYWSAEGMTSFKAYMHITPEELKAAIDHAHAKGLKVTGHLCSVGFKEAAALGIDNLEHGLAVDTEFYPEKKSGVCPGQNPPQVGLAKLDVEGSEIQGTIKDLIAHHVAVTSTLAIFESFVANRPSMDEEMRVRESLLPQAWGDYVTTRAEIAEGERPSPWPVLLKQEMQFEHDFVKQGGLLMAGCDPTGYGGVLPGFGDQRNVELLVEAGFSPEEAIHIATENGAQWLGEDARIGTVAAGKTADLVVVTGNPAKNIHDIEKVDVVFKDGVGYSPQKLIESVRGLVGIR
ncbi:imidazolonepropionase-like amidohydrolase [Silvibacterium bohemicum]|uniref:Imidazolonepropionase-like amidohydrolase n=1 Tax=Silvibacterium bohemicum TaxID=1577686 RepID=A0A841K3C1_9BACT|nr:amidohydrolase family protein [Silvibacterium bohemicum]MBB6147067.1 imidazolonepropionase-like amidohydrolase [Silvibacterium bohemicum]